MADRNGRKAGERENEWKIHKESGGGGGKRRCFGRKEKEAEVKIKV